MAKHTVTLIPGDGIGTETTAAMQRVVAAAGADIEWEIAEAGAHLMEEFGTRFRPLLSMRFVRIRSPSKGLSPLQ